MIDFKKIGNYKISSIRYSSKDLSVYIGFLGDTNSKKMFFINEFEHNEKNKKIFRDLFLYFVSKNKTKCFYDFFSKNNYFYAVFDYFEGQNIIYKYNKKVCVSSFDERTKIFENMCIKISNYIYKKTPQIIIGCSMNPENIVISEKFDVMFNFNMKSIYDITKLNYYNDHALIKTVHKIFNIFFEIEKSSKYNHTIQFISKKCEFGIYKFISELVIDLKNRYAEASISSFTQFWKYQFNVRKKQISRYVKYIFTIVVVISFGMIMWQKVKPNLKDSGKGVNAKIGEINYLVDESDSADKMISIGTTSITPTLPSKKSISIPKDAEIEYEDYIIKQGDTPGSISENFYGDSSFGSVITSFNELSGALIPGTIIKIPSKFYLQNE